MKRIFVKNAVVLSVALALASLGIYNIVLKATWTMMSDGVFWTDATQGVVADIVSARHPGALAGIRPGDVLLAIGGEEVLNAAQVDARIRAAHQGPLTYSLLRAEARQSIDVVVQPLSQGRVSLFYYLSLVGFFSLLVGTIVMLRRPPDRVALHFYAICLLFFLMYSLSYTGKANLADWTLFWGDHLAILLLPVVFLHFCLSFPERRLPTSRGWVIPASYLPALGLAGAAVASQVFLRASPGGGHVLIKLSETIDSWQPFYFGALFAVSFAILLDSYGKTKSLTARKQMKWLVWGTGAGVLPFFLFYAVPFALGREPDLPMELAGYIPVGLIPLSLAYAVVKHRLMDVELLFRRTLGYTLAIAVIIGICLVAVNVVQLTGDDEPHVTAIAVLCALLVAVLFSPVKSRVQEGIDRLFFRERYSFRKALLRLSQDLNADLDLARMAERLLEGVGTALGVKPLAVFLPDGRGSYAVFRSLGFEAGSEQLRLPAQGALLSRLAAGEPVNAETSFDPIPEAGPLNLSHYFPCRAKGEVIAIIGVGRKEGFDPLNSEEIDLLQALAGQTATAFMNGRLYGSLQEKANQLQELTEYNENILESIDSGILVLDLNGCVVRWSRAMETLYGMSKANALGGTLDDIFPGTFMEALRGSLVLGRHEEIANIYKLHLPTPDGRSLMVNVSVAPFQLDGERRGTILIVDDVTARMRLEEQLQHSEKMASIGLLAAGVAHEVNTPLAGISSYTQLLLGELDEADPKNDLLRKIEKQSFRAAKIVNNLLNFARSGTSEFETLDVNKILQDVLSLVDHQLDASRIKLRRELADHLPPVRGNENRLQQVFFNLVLNARDAMPSGGWLTLRTRADEDAVVVEVADTGDGIRKEDIKRIYDPFFTTKGIGRGTGLGLSVSYGILQEHGGAIFVDSAPGQGTTFQVALPPLRVAEAATR